VAADAQRHTNRAERLHLPVKLVSVSGDEFLLDGSNGASSIAFSRNMQGT
jgi:hypothetical protein